MTPDFAGQRVLLVGGHGGIGAALGQALLRTGAEVIATSTTPHPSPVAGLGAESMDVTDLESVRALAQRLDGRPLHALVNCAGFNGNRSLFSDGWSQAARREMDVNYFGLLHLAAVFGPVLALQRGGRFVTVLSFLSHLNLPMMASYCASKAAAHSALQAIRAEWQSSGVRVCGVYPMAVDTAMSRDVQGDKLPPDALAQEVLQAMAGDGDALYPGMAQAAFLEFLADPVGTQRMAAGAAGGR